MGSQHRARGKNSAASVSQEGREGGREGG
eukprot:COSAG01_NODE_23768_length_802_cov_1.391181_1_plen_28_part_01